MAVGLSKGVCRRERKQRLVCDAKLVQGDGLVESKQMFFLVQVRDGVLQCGLKVAHVHTETVLPRPGMVKACRQQDDQ